MTFFNKSGKNLNENHRKYLRDHAISDAVIDYLNIVSVTPETYPEQLPPIPWAARKGFVYWQNADKVKEPVFVSDRRGEIVAGHDGKEVEIAKKYRVKNSTLGGWLLHDCEDKAKKLFIIEGEKQALAFLSVMMGSKGEIDGAVVAMHGCWGFGNSRRMNTFFKRIVRDRSVCVIFDADVKTNPNVAAAKNDLFVKLINCGARGDAIYFPVVPDNKGAKTGLDDYLAGIQEQCRLNAVQNLLLVGKENVSEIRLLLPTLGDYKGRRGYWKNISLDFQNQLEQEVLWKEQGNKHLWGYNPFDSSHTYVSEKMFSQLCKELLGADGYGGISSGVYDNIVGGCEWKKDRGSIDSFAEGMSYFPFVEGVWDHVDKKFYEHNPDDNHNARYNIKKAPRIKGKPTPEVHYQPELVYQQPDPVEEAEWSNWLDEREKSHPECAIIDYLWIQSGCELDVFQKMRRAIMPLIDFGREAEFFVVFYDNGGTGKTQFVNVLARCVGLGNHTGTTLAGICDESRKVQAELIGKYCVGIDDASTSYISDVSLLKRLTGGSLGCLVEKKYGNHMPADFYCKPYITMNGKLTVSGSDVAFYDRLVAFNFKHKWRGTGVSKPKWGLTRTPDQLSCFVNWLMKDYKPSLSIDYFLSKSHDFIEQVDPIVACINKCTRPTDDEAKWMNANALYKTFEKFCEKDNHKVCGLREFYRRLTNLSDSGFVVKKRNCKRTQDGTYKYPVEVIDERLWVLLDSEDDVRAKKPWGQKLALSEEPMLEVNDDLPF